jgi:hypothetical protein
VVMVSLVNGVGDPTPEVVPKRGWSEIVFNMPAAAWSGNATCTPAPDLAVYQSNPNTSCVAGCCSGGTCECRDGYVGALCQYSLRCALVPIGGSSFVLSDPDEPDEPECATLTAVGSADSARVVCACQQLGLVGVVRLRVQPASNLDLESHHVSDMWAVMAIRPAWWVAPLCLYVLAMLAAATADAGTLYKSAEATPFWLQPRRFSLKLTLLTMMLTRSSLLRIFHVHPDHGATRRIGSRPRVAEPMRH